jgi:DNA-binding NarL/FixJ family response regulator
MAEGPVFVIDGDRLSLRLLCGLLERDGFQTRVASTGDDAFELMRQERPMLVILDVHIPGTSGYAIQRRLRERFGERLPIILISGERTEPLDRVAGLMLGADDYIVKPFDPDELVARIHALCRRAGVSESEGDPGAGLPVLTRREHEILKLLAAGLDQVQIANRLVISPKTVSTHIQHVLAKLGVHSRAQAVAVALRAAGTESVPEAPHTGVGT